MPRQSERDELIESVALAYAVDSLIESEAALDAEMDTSSSEGTASSSSSSYIHARHHVDKTSENIRLLFEVYKEHEPVLFKAYTRVDPACFDALLEAIQDNPAFHNDSNSAQMPVHIQLAIALYRFGHYGNAASVTKVALWAGVSYGMVMNATRRVILAFCSPEFRRRVMNFPDFDSPDRAEAKEWVEDQSCPGWRKGWLMVDGTLIPIYAVKHKL
jgi:hypothetical protein